MTEPDEALLWARERAKERFSSPVYINICAQIDAGDWDDDLTYSAEAYRAGARMAREQERERAKVLVDYVEAYGLRFDGCGVARRTLAKYLGEA